MSRRPTRRILAGAGVAAAAVTALLVIPGPGPEPAFAVSADTNGDVKELEDHGINADVTYLDYGLTCARAFIIADGPVAPCSPVPAE